VTEAVLAGGYRGVMGAAAALAGLRVARPGRAAVVARLARAPRPLRRRGARRGGERAGDVAARGRRSGELTASRPLLRALRERFPGAPPRDSRRSRAPGSSRRARCPEAHLAFLLPLDAARPVRRIISTLRLDAFFFTETEIWPTLLQELAEAGVPAFMVSGRVSERTVARTRWLRRSTGARSRASRAVCRPRRMPRA
jgi:3-deoxy-D-manno-octulosonic-acid transferase